MWKRLRAGISVFGNLNVPSIYCLHKSLLQIQEDHSIRDVIPDFGKLKFLGTSGIGELIAFYKEFTLVKENKIVFTNLNEKFRMLFQNLNLDKIFCIKND